MQLQRKHQTILGAHPLQMCSPESEACSLVGWKNSRWQTWLKRKSYRPGRINTRPLGLVVYSQTLPKGKRGMIDTWGIMRATDREHILATGKGSPPGYAIEQRVRSLTDRGGTEDNQWRGRATPLCLAGAQSHGAQGSWIIHTFDNHTQRLVLPSAPRFGGERGITLASRYSFVCVRLLLQVYRVVLKLSLPLSIDIDR